MGGGGGCVSLASLSSGGGGCVEGGSAAGDVSPSTHNIHQHPVSYIFVANQQPGERNGHLQL